jgi:hypothetical protein
LRHIVNTHRGIEASPLVVDIQRGAHFGGPRPLTFMNARV